MAFRNFTQRNEGADCAKGKHSWLVNKIEPTEGSPAEQQYYRVYGYCHLCQRPGQSDLLTRQQLPVNEALFTCLNPVRLPKAQ
jgi:hypothetical protein